jgi:hypothetical protein
MRPGVNTVKRALPEVITDAGFATGWNFCWAKLPIVKRRSSKSGVIFMRFDIGDQYFTMIFESGFIFYQRYKPLHKTKPENDKM